MTNADISLPCLWTAPKNLLDREQKIQQTTMTLETAEAILYIVRDQWRWTSEVDLTRSWWVPNRDAQTGIMNLLLEGGFPNRRHRALKMSRDSRRGQSKRDSSGLLQLLKDC